MIALGVLIGGVISFVFMHALPADTWWDVAARSLYWSIGAALAFGAGTLWRRSRQARPDFEWRIEKAAAVLAVLGRQEDPTLADTDESWRAVKLTAWAVLRAGVPEMFPKSPPQEERRSEFEEAIRRPYANYAGWAGTSSEEGK